MDLLVTNADGTQTLVGNVSKLDITDIDSAAPVRELYRADLLAIQAQLIELTQRVAAALAV